MKSYLPSLVITGLYVISVKKLEVIFNILVALYAANPYLVHLVTMLLVKVTFLVSFIYTHTAILSVKLHPSMTD
jgi:hypothetical protein